MATVFFAATQVASTFFYYNMGNEDRWNSRGVIWWMEACRQSMYAGQCIALAWMSNMIRSLDGKDGAWTKLVWGSTVINIFWAFWWSMFIPFGCWEELWGHAYPKYDKLQNTWFVESLFWFFLDLKALSYLGQAAKQSDNFKGIPMILTRLAVFFGTLCVFSQFIFDSYSVYNVTKGYYTWRWMFYLAKTSTFQMVPMVATILCALKPPEMEEGKQPLVANHSPTNNGGNMTVVTTTTTYPAQPGQEYSYQQPPQQQYGY